MDTFIDWYHTLPSEARIYWSVALFASVVFVIQMILTFVGLGHTDGMDADLSGADAADFTDGHTMDTGGAMQLFTLRNVVNFLLGLGWGGVCLGGVVRQPALLCLAALAVGALFVYIFVLIMRQLMRLESAGNFTYQQCVGLPADVYLRIPAQRSGTGKVQVSVEGSVHELDAVTDGPLLPSGTKVTIKGLADGRTLIV